MWASWKSVSYRTEQWQRKNRGRAVLGTLYTAVAGPIRGKRWKGEGQYMQALWF